MKRLVCVLLISITFCLALQMEVGSQANVIVRERITITVDKAQVRTDVPPISVQGRTLVPVRGVFDAFNATIDWFPVEKRVYIRHDNQVIWLRIGEDQASVDEEIVPLEVPAMIYRGRTMVPLRFIAESLGATVDYNASTQTITITERSVATPEPVREPDVNIEPNEP